MATVTKKELPEPPPLTEASAAVLEIQPLIQLTPRDSQLFADLMETDEEPVEALRQAALAYQQTINRQSL
jgi:uncharacterized protein (DUF1778 family)